MAELEDIATNEDMVQIANAIRKVTRTTSPMTIPQMPERLLDIRVIEKNVVTVNFSAAGPVLLGAYDASIKHFFIAMPRENIDATTLASVKPLLDLVFDDETGGLYIAHEEAVDVDVEFYVLDMLLASDGETAGALVSGGLGGTSILAYDSTASYEVGDLFLYDNTIGITIVAHEAESINFSHNRFLAARYVETGEEVDQLVDLYDAVSKVEGDISLESQRAQQAESELSDSITDEENRAEQAELSLSRDIQGVAADLDVEGARAQGAESNLSEAISQEESRAKQAEQDLADAIEAIEVPVTSVNSKTGNVVLDATDIKLTTNQQTVQQNFIRVDEEINRVDEAKVEKVNTTGGKKVIYSAQGQEQGTVDLSNSPEEGKVPVYDSNGNIKSGVPVADNDVMTKKTAEDSFAPLSFVANLYGNMAGANLIRLLDTKPTASANNILQILNSTNTDYDWNSPSVIFERKIAVATTLVKTNSLTFTLKYLVSRDVTISWGARVQYSADGQTWENLSSNQSFSAVTIKVAEGGVSTDITVFMDSIVGSKSVAKDSYLRVLLFKKAGGATPVDISLYFGVMVDNAYVGTFAQFNFASVHINTEQIEDKSVTKQKLSDGLADEIDGKLDKVSSTSASERVYGVDATGEQEMVGITSEATSGALAKRDSNGNFKVGTPTDNSHATNKGYVDGGLSGKQATIDSSHKLSADLIEDGTTNKTVTQGEKTAWNSKQSGTTINGTSIVNAQGVAEIQKASNSEIDAKTSSSKIIVPSNLVYATKVGMLSNTSLTDTEKNTIKTNFGITAGASVDIEVL